MHVLVETEFGNFKILLFSKIAPLTVANFIGLAEGTKEFTNHLTGLTEKRPFYDGLAFHRIIKDFIIQTGCPFGNGDGGPGYTFNDEIDPVLNKHNKAGLVSMSNVGPNTNGSQFFITLAATPWLDTSHTIFGEVVEGLDVINSLVNAQTVSGDIPFNMPKIIKMKVLNS